MSEMVAKVADAIEAAYRNDDDSHSAMLRMARSAIEAMRDPTFEMRGAAQQAFIRKDGGTITAMWNAMIDAALDRKIQSD